MGAGRGITFAIEALDKFSAPLAAFNRKITESTAGLRTLGSRMGALGRESGLTKIFGAGAGVGKAFDTVSDRGMALAGKLTLVGGGLAYGFKKGFVDTASQFEKFETILNTLNRGDTGKSKKEMGWISDFAAKTPYELAEVTDAFVKLRSYGMEPMTGLLQTLGDTSSSMGKPLSQAVEAIADAVTGENERLKEFGITANKAGQKIVYNYTDADGKQAKLVAKAGDRMAIQATLMKVWQEKYGGGMEAQSKTFGGMMSNLSDAWARFAMKVMSGGAFDWMKQKLSGILDTIDRMSADGSLDAWASQWGERLTTFLSNAWDAALGFAGALTTIGHGLAWTADLLGGWGNLAKVVAVFMGLKLVVALGQLAVSFWTLGAAIMTTPIGWIAGGLALVAIGVVAVWRNWDKLAAYVRENPIFATMAAMVSPLLTGITMVIGGLRALWRNWDQIIGWIKDKTPTWVLKMFGADEGGGNASGREGASPGAMRDAGKAWGDFSAGPALGASLGVDQVRPTLGVAALQKQITEQRSTSLERKESKLTVDFANVPRGATIKSAGAPVDTAINYDMGLANAY